MEKLFNIDITDIIDKAQSSPNFNDEMIILKIDGADNADSNYRVQIDAFSIIIKFEGQLDIAINDHDYHVVSDALIHIFDIHTVGQVRRSADFRGYHVIISHDLMANTMRGIKRLPLSSFLSCFDFPIIELSDKESTLLERCLSDVLTSIDNKSHTYYDDIVKNEVRGLMLEVSNIVVLKSTVREVNKYRRKEDIIAQFIVLINRHAMQEHSVSFYAEKLCVEVKYLSRILKETTGKTANTWIDEVIIIQAKMMLKDDEMTIQQIVDALHFSDQSSFGKFFKKHSGTSPFNYRLEQM